MLSFKSHLPEDKDSGFTTPEEDPCTNLIEQYLNEDPIDFGDTLETSNGFQGFDFAFEETESSESCSADSKHANSQPAYFATSSSFEPVPIQQPLPLRVRTKFAPCDAPGRSISGNELLNLEGRAAIIGEDPRILCPPASSTTAPTLRRKNKFCAPATEALRGRAQRVIKTPSAEMIRPSYRGESPSYNEWTQRFEQISIQAQMTEAQSFPSRNTGAYREKRPSNITTSFDQAQQSQQQAQAQHGLPGSTSDQTQRGSTSQSNHINTAAGAPLPPDWHNQNQSQTQPSPIAPENYIYDTKPAVSRAQTQQQLRHPPSWNYGPVSPLTPDFTITLKHVQPSWLHSMHSNTNSYYENGSSGPLSAPALPTYSNPDFSSPTDLGGLPYESFAQFVNEDPSVDYSVLSPDPYFAPSTNTLSSDLPNHQNPQKSTTNPLHPQTPPPALPLSPSTPHGPSPTKPHPRSCHPHHRRQKSLGALKSPKSASALKSQKLASALKSPKSTGNFGFVNFTGADKGKILTGVAPSGSSKTKARRELEAMERKRRLSQAAVRAVREVGGDVGVLRAEGFEC